MVNPDVAARRPARPALSRERVLRAAVALADEGGLGALSMRKLGQAVGVEAMSLYHHVANKDDVLDGMVDLVFAEIELPGPEVGWREAMAVRAASARSALARHPWALGVMESRTTPGPATLGHHDAVIACLRRAGFPIPLVAHAVAAIDSYVYGFALQEATLPFDRPGGAAEVAEEVLGRHQPGAHPHLEELAREHVMRPGYDFGDEFGWGLELLLDGIERALAEHGAAPGG